jgi:hypothetical protein
MSVPAPAAPSHLLRLHSSAINTLALSADNERLYSGDTSGVIVTTSTRSLRAITKWQAHADGLLGIEEWGDEVITYARSIYLRGYCILIADDNRQTGMDETINSTFGSVFSNPPNLLGLATQLRVWISLHRS